MDELILRVLNGTATDFERERLRRWRQERSANEAAFREAEAVWSLTEPETAKEWPAPRARDIAALAETRRAQATPLAARRPRWHRRWSVRAAGVAAAMAAALAAVALGLRLTEPEMAPLAVYSGDDVALATLADGSFVRLAPGSRLEDHSTEDARTVTLEGRAFFAVEHDAARPFEIRTDAGTVRVLGTRFELAGAADSLRVVVVEGVVAVANDSGSVEVPRGSVAYMAGGAAPRSAAADDVYAFLDWPDGLLVYRGTPLVDVAAEVTRRFGRVVRVEDDGLRARRVSGAFSDTAFDAMVESLCVVTGAECVPDGTDMVMRLVGGGEGER